MQGVCINNIYTYTHTYVYSPKYFHRENARIEYKLFFFTPPLLKCGIITAFFFLKGWIQMGGLIRFFKLRNCEFYLTYKFRSLWTFLFISFKPIANIFVTFGLPFPFNVQTLAWTSENIREYQKMKKRFKVWILANVLWKTCNHASKVFFPHAVVMSHNTKRYIKEDSF